MIWSFGSLCPSCAGGICPDAGAMERQQEILYLKIIVLKKIRFFQFYYWLKFAGLKTLEFLEFFSN
jgi:hypothetical protein